uniref:RAP domain-containing protein n=1 Tax=Alexandrium catenella TaxID=2925 RepID=A0A7S1RGS0_ALECA
MEAFLSQAGKQAKNRFRLSQEVGSSAFLDRLRSALPALFPNMACEERFAVPSTPYVVDLALEDRGLLLVVPRAAHLAAGSRELSGSAQLMERTLEAMGWKLQWIWPEQWSPRLDSLAGSEGKEEALDALRGLVGLGSRAADGSVGPELQAA